MFRVVVKLGCVHKIIHVLMSSEIVPRYNRTMKRYHKGWILLYTNYYTDKNYQVSFSLTVLPTCMLSHCTSSTKFWPIQLHISIRIVTKDRLASFEFKMLMFDLIISIEIWIRISVNCQLEAYRNKIVGQWLQLLFLFMNN